MKVIEQVVSADNNKKIETVSIGNKKYKRISFIKKNNIEWKRFKTNHQVNKSQHDDLEKSYLNRFKNPSPRNTPDSYFNGNNMYSSGATSIHSAVSVDASNFMQSEEFDSAELERGLVKASNNGVRKLAGVKFIKEETGWGLREAKDFVDAFFKRKKVYNR